MPEKIKRKTNPRRRLLIQLIFGIVLIISLISAGLYMLRPTGAQIIFIASDPESNSRNIWLVDVNNPENLRPLLDNPTITEISEMDVASDGRLIVYKQSEAEQQSIEAVNIETGQQQTISICNSSHICNRAMVDPQGRWVAFEIIERLTEQTDKITLSIYDFQNDTQDVVYSFETERKSSHSPILLGWIRNSGWLVYRATLDDRDEIIYYDIQSEQIVERAEISEGYFPEPLFSRDGSSYISTFNFEIYDINLELYHLEAPYRESVPLLMQEDDFSRELIRFEDWYSDNKTLLFTGSWLPHTDERRYDIGLYDTETNSQTIIHRNDLLTEYTDASFNYDGSKILYQTWNVASGDGSMTIHDIASGEEIRLYLSGWNPQWVNGGR